VLLWLKHRNHSRRLEISVLAMLAASMDTFHNLCFAASPSVEIIGGFRVVLTASRKNNGSEGDENEERFYLSVF
jgi:hypothetical protein